MQKTSKTKIRCEIVNLLWIYLLLRIHEDITALVSSKNSSCCDLFQILNVGRVKVFSAVCTHCLVHIWATQIFFFTLIQQNFYQYFCPVFIQTQKPQNHHKHPGPADLSLFPYFSKYSSVWSHSSTTENKQHFNKSYHSV